MKTIASDAAHEAEFQPWKHVAAFLLAYALLVTRRPDALFHAQFFAEDGHVWIADAYNLGWWPSLLRTWSSCFQTLPRLVANLALLGPLSMAPLVLNLIAVAVQALPVNLLLSTRSSAWGSLGFRALLATVYLALPNSMELSFGITESQWLLAFSAFILLVAQAPRGLGGRAFDLSVVLLCGLSGPFCFFLLPIAVFLAWRRRERWRWASAGILAALCIVQTCGLLIVDPSGRPHHALGANPAMFARLLAGQIYLGAILGGNGLAASSSPMLVMLLIVAAISGTVLVSACFARTTVEMKLFLLFSAMVLAASLISPTCDPPRGISVWGFLAAIPGLRYWFFPTLAFGWSLMWCFRSRYEALRVVAAPLLLIMCLGIARDWRQPAFKDLHFTENARRFEAAPAGMAITIPENPDGWSLRLVKRSARP